VGNPRHASELGSGSSSVAAALRATGRLNLGSFGAGGIWEAGDAGRPPACTASVRQRGRGVSGASVGAGSMLELELELELGGGCVRSNANGSKRGNVGSNSSSASSSRFTAVASLLGAGGVSDRGGRRRPVSFGPNPSLCEEPAAIRNPKPSMARFVAFTTKDLLTRAPHRFNWSGHPPRAAAAATVSYLGVASVSQFANLRIYLFYNKPSAGRAGQMLQVLRVFSRQRCPGFARMSAGPAARERASFVAARCRLG